ncbi:hypothetical protein TNIN_11161 [Trichonephila inaurata madagascariensis]|uniref:Uncharacterized protein n=1 Tax=Trichonephila inaurata madagascariensis TaxID=2747483 RepID=A0A8X6X6A7_9ARAC|nr:hypothetical protein TNIN_11161 [Trichonephila inaurata madagascariensis]
MKLHGSAQDDGSAGAGFCYENLFEGFLTAGLGATNFDAKIEAMRQAICHLTITYLFCRRAVFLVDSQSARSLLSASYTSGCQTF